MFNYWRQGFLLDTKFTRLMSGSERMEAREYESKRVYRNFTTEDAGRSRQLVAVCETAEIAALIVKLHNDTARQNDNEDNSSEPA